MWYCVHNVCDICRSGLSCEAYLTPSNGEYKETRVTAMPGVDIRSRVKCETTTGFIELGTFRLLVGEVSGKVNLM